MANKVIDKTKEHLGEGFQMLSAKKPSQNEVVQHEIVFFKRWPLENKRKFIRWAKIFFGVIGLICLLILVALYYTFIDN